MLLAGCAGHVPAPVSSRGTHPPHPPAVTGKAVPAAPVRQARPARHRVRKGETLYAIAWRYRLDYRTLARWNGIGPPYLIRPGQQLWLRPPVVPATAGHHIRQPVRSATAKGARTVRGSKKKSQKPAAAARTKASRKPADKGGFRRLRWRWPAEGKVVRTRAALGTEGIDIYGRLGQAVRASEGGKVVYSGSGLIGYGKLVIIKHDDEYLSAYAHNQTLLVKEGEQVERGQQIARMGQSGTDRVKLHFEIRRDGKPVPPLRYLPSRK